jgi:hypothetical protein
MKPWTFAREARWMMIIGLLAPAIILVIRFVVPWLRRALGLP